MSASAIYYPHCLPYQPPYYIQPCLLLLLLCRSLPTMLSAPTAVLCQTWRRMSSSTLGKLPGLYLAWLWGYLATLANWWHAERPGKMHFRVG